MTDSDLVLRALELNTQLTQPQIVEATKLRPEAVRNAIRNLSGEGRVAKEADGRNIYWRLSLYASVDVRKAA